MVALVMAVLPTQAGSLYTKDLATSKYDIYSIYGMIYVALVLKNAKCSI